MVTSTGSAQFGGFASLEIVGIRVRHHKARAQEKSSPHQEKACSLRDDKNNGCYFDVSSIKCYASVTYSPSAFSL